MLATETALHITGMLMVFSASGIGGLGYSLTQALLMKWNMAMDTLVATVFSLAPVTGFTLAFVRISVEGWGHVFS